MDAYDLWEMHQHALDQALERCPVCADCGEYIQDHYYEISGEAVCPDCLESNYRKEVADYV